MKMKEAEAVGEVYTGRKGVKFSRLEMAGDAVGALVGNGVGILNGKKKSLMMLCICGAICENLIF
jgi:hypothetical protein